MRSNRVYTCAEHNGDLLLPFQCVLQCDVLEALRIQETFTVVLTSPHSAFITLANLIVQTALWF